MRAATGAEPALHVRSRGLFDKAERFDRLPADVEVAKAYVRTFVRG